MNRLLIIILLFSTDLLSAQPHARVKILTFNILHGATTNNNFDLDAIARVINEADADLVALQEVDFRTKRAKDYDLVTELAWRTKMQGIFGRAMYYDGGEYGEGILSRHTLLSSRNVALPFSEGNEPRAALEVTVILPAGDTISFIGTHLDHLKDPTDRIQQGWVFICRKYFFYP